MPSRPIPTAPHWNFDDTEPTEYKAGPTFDLGGETFHCMSLPPLGALWRLEGTNIIDRRKGVILSAVPDAIGFVEDVLCVELPADPQPTPDVVEATDEAGTALETRAIPTLVMEPCDDVARWQKLVDDKTRPVPALRLAKVVNQLYEYYTNFPTDAS